MLSVRWVNFVLTPIIVFQLMYLGLLLMLTGLTIRGRIELGEDAF